MRIVMAILAAVFGGFGGALAGGALCFLSCAILSDAGFNFPRNSLEPALGIGFLVGAIGLPLIADWISPPKKSGGALSASPKSPPDSPSSSADWACGFCVGLAGEISIWALA
jgi:hypothetical protein